MISFPNRVWFETREGWASREATPEDKAARKEWLDLWNNRDTRHLAREVKRA